MATHTLATNIGRAIRDFNGIRDAITEKGIQVPAGTKTSDYDDLIRRILSGDVSFKDFLKAATDTVSVNNNGDSINHFCEPFTKKIVSYNGLWLNHGKIESINASFEKLVSGVDMFNGDSDGSSGPLFSIRSVKTNLNSLTDGTRMFAYQYMFTFETVNNELPRLVNGDNMFNYNTELTSFGVNMPRLENGYMMFAKNQSLNSFSADIPNLKSGQHMFGDCANLINFTSPLQSLQDGTDMFYACDRLSVESLQNIITTLPDRSLTTNATLTIGNTNIAKLDIYYIQLAAGKNWTLN